MECILRLIKVTYVKKYDEFWNKTIILTKLLFGLRFFEIGTISMARAIFTFKCKTSFDFF